MDLDIDRHRAEDAYLLRESLTLVAPVADAMVTSFYDRLFTDFPQLRVLFPAVMDVQRERLLKAIIVLVTHYDRPEVLLPALIAMGRRHLRYGATLRSYGAFGTTLLRTLESYAGDAWTPEVAAAWERAYAFAAGTMLRAATEMGASDARAAQQAA